MGMIMLARAAVAGDAPEPATSAGAPLPALPSPPAEPPPPAAPTAWLPPPAPPKPAEKVAPPVSAPPRTVPAAVLPAPTAKPSTPRSLLVSIGLGESAEADGGYGHGSGFYAAGDYVMPAESWLSLRAYAGLILTSPDTTSCNGVSPCDTSAKIVFGGVKARVMAPIPYVAPFLELGLGLAGGAINRQDSTGDSGTVNFTFQLPLGGGLALGKNNDVDLMLLYLLEPLIGHLDGAFAIGVAITL
jgi:hypothetical protein